MRSKSTSNSCSRRLGNHRRTIQRVIPLSTAWARIHSLCKTLEMQKEDLLSINETAENLNRRVSEMSKQLTTI